MHSTRPHILRGLFMKIKCILNSENVVLAAFDNKEKNRAKYAQKLSGRKKGQDIKFVKRIFMVESFYTPYGPIIKEVK